MLILRNVIKRLFAFTIYRASYEKGYGEILDRLKSLVPDITKQYTNFEILDVFQEAMVRTLHAFQVSLIQAVLKLKDQDRLLNVVDIGDSSGTHLIYLQDEKISLGKKLDTLSVNIDPIAVEKIRSKGLRAIECRAEELIKHREFKDKNVDVFLLFETLEHLLDPINFLHNLSESCDASYLIITVPYLKRSKVALHQLRGNMNKKMTAEETHIFELNPNDWRLLFRFSGWEIVEDRIFRMYPTYNPLVFMKLLWKKFAFDGYYGCILKKDSRISDRYDSW